MAGSVGSDLDLALRIRALVEGQDAIVGLGASFVDLNQRIESLIRGLKAITGSQEGAAKEFEYIASVADKYGRSLLDLSDNYIKLIAASKDTTLEGAAVKEVFEAVSSSMAVLGADTATTHRAFNSLNQMMSKGQIYSEELKGQLAEAIPGALGIMSRALGITTQDMLRLMESGSLTSDVLLPFARQLQKEFGQSAADTTIFAQEIDRLKNAWTLLMKQIGDTGAWNAFGKIIGFVADNSALLAGALGVGLAVAAQKATVALSGYVASAYESAKATLAGVGPAQQAALVQFELAQANVANAESSLQAAIASRDKAKADLQAAATAQQTTIARERLAIATRQVLLADQQAAVAANELAVAQARLTGTQSLWSKSMSFLAGPGGMIALMVAGFAAMALAFREQDDLTKNIAKSTEDYAESLKKMSATAIVESSKRLEAQKQEDEALVSSYKSRIAGIQKAIEYIQAEGDARNDAAIRIAEYNKDIIADTLEMEKIQARLVDIDIKLAAGRGTLADKSVELNIRQSELLASSVSLAAQIEEERRNVADLQKQKAAGLDVDDRLQAAYKNLSSLERQRSKNLSDLQLNTANIVELSRGYAKSMLDSMTASEQAALGYADQSDAIDALSEKVQKTVQYMLALDQRQRDLVAAGKLMKAQYDALEKTIGDVADIQLREANAIGDVVRQRELSVAQGQAQADLAEKGLAIAENELRASQALLESKQAQLSINTKMKTALEKEINDLKTLIVSQQAEIDKRGENVKATVLEANARRQAIETTSESFARQQAELARATQELLTLQVKYQELQASGENLKVLATVFEQIADKQQRVSLLAQSMAGIMSQAAKNVGQDWEEMTAGFDRKTRQMIDSLEQLALRGVLTGQQLRKSIDNAISTSDTEKELNALSTALFELFDNGKIGADELKLKFGDILVKLAALKAEADPTSQALAKLGINVPIQLDAIAEAAKRSFDVIAAGTGTITQIDDAFLKYAESAIKAAVAGEAPINPLLKAQAAALGLGNAFDEMVRSMERADPEFEAIIAKLDRVSELSSKRRELLRQEGETTAQVTEANIAHAKTMADEISLAYQLIVQQETALQNARLEADAAEQKAAEKAKELAAIKALEASGKKLSVSDKERLELLRLEVPLLQQTAAQARAKSDALKEYQFSIEGVNAAMQQLTSLAEQEANQNNKILSARNARLQAEKELATAFGATAQAQQKESEIAANNAEIARNQAEGKRQAAIAVGEYAQKLADAAAQDGVLTESELKGIEVARQNAEAMREVAVAARVAEEAAKKNANAQAEEVKAIAELKEHVEQLKAAGDFVSGVLSGWAQRLQALSPAAREAFDGFTEGTDLARGGIEALDRALAKNLEEQGKLTGLGGGFVQWANQVADKALDIEAAFLSQARAAEILVRQLGTVGNSNGLDILIRKAEMSREQFDLLDQQRLDNLQSAIDGATDRLQRMKGETEDARQALAELNAEILAEQGNTAAADSMKRKIEEEQKLADLEAARAQAQLENNAELVRLIDEQIRKTKELYDLKEQNARNEANAAKTASATSGTSGSTTTTTTTTPPKTGTTASGGNGISVTVNAPNAYFLDPKAANDLARLIKPALDDLNRRLA